MQRTQIIVWWRWAVILVVAIAGNGSQLAVAQGPVAVGDIVQTGLNGQNVIGEVIRAGGGTVDLNLGENNVSKLVSLQFVKVLQKTGTGGKALCAAGDTVQVSYVANTTFTGRMMKTNGGYCEFDASGSGFTGWSKCSEVRRVPGGTSCAPAAAAGRAGAAPAPPKPGLTSCAGKFEGRYATTAGLGGLTIVFRAGKATLSGPLSDNETFECWTGGGKIILHKEGQDDLPIEINDDGTLDTPLGELKKKAS